MKRRKGLPGKIDILFSLCLRESRNWTCEYTGEYFPPDRRHGLHCSHLYGRRHAATRWLPDNCFAHSAYAHRYLGENPVIFAVWAREQLGDTLMDMVAARHNQIARYREKDYRGMLEHYQAEYDRMLQQRVDGETGVLQLTAYD